MKEYLTTAELSNRIKMAPGTIRNLVWKKEFIENIHYFKPTSRKILFVWSEIEKWLYNDPLMTDIQSDVRGRSLINI